MNPKSHRSIEEDRRQYTLIILTTVFIAFLVGGLPSFLSQAVLTSYRFLVPYVTALIAAIIALLFVIVRPANIKQDLLMLLPYDLDSESFLAVKGYSCSVFAREFYARATGHKANLKLPSEHKLVESWQASGKPPGEEEMEGLSGTRERLLTQFVQALLVNWIISFHHKPTLSFTFPLPLLPDLHHDAQFPASYIKFGQKEKLQEDVKLDTEGIENPFLDDLYPLEYTFPQNTEFKLTKEGIMLSHKHIAMNVNCHLLRITTYPYPSPYGEVGFLEPMRNELPSQFSCSEFVFVVRFSARVGRMARDLYPGVGY